MAEICIAGAGYIGLPTSAVFSAAGHKVVCYDVDDKKITRFKNREFDVGEPKLSQLLVDSMDAGCLDFSTSPTAAQVYIICVPSPLIRMEGCVRQDKSFVYGALSSILSVCPEDAVIVVETTSEIGFTDELSSWLASEFPEFSRLRCAYCAERIIPGALIDELYSNSRVIGVNCKKTGDMLKELYQSALPSIEIDVVNTKEAEAVKLVENAFRDTNIAFANSIFDISNAYEISAQTIIKLANKHPRVQILTPGIGVGGHCISIDPWFLTQVSGYGSDFIKNVRETNDSVPGRVVQLISDEYLRHCEYNGSKDILFLGMTYKADVDDLRESPAVQIISKFCDISPDAQVKVFEPLVTCERVEATVPRKVQRVSQKDLDSLSQSTMVVLLVPHKQITSMADWLCKFFINVYDPFRFLS